MENVGLNRFEWTYPRKWAKDVFLVLFAVGLLAGLLCGLPAPKVNEPIATHNVTRGVSVPDASQDVHTTQTTRTDQLDLEELIAILPQVIDEFEVTAYTAGPESTGKRPGHPAYGITKSGAPVQEWHTIAADPKVLPLGTKVLIPAFADKPNGGVFVVQDTGKRDGSKTAHGTYRHIQGHRLDIYHPDVEWARKFGRQKLVVIRLDKLAQKLGEEEGW